MTELQHASATAAGSARRPWLYFGLMAAAAVVLFLIVVLNPSTVEGHPNPLFHEGGLVEEGAPYGYLACVLLIFILGGWRFGLGPGLPLNLLLLVLTMRELDFHTRFTSMSMTKLKFYISASVPLHEKVPAVVVLALLTWVVVVLIARNARPFLKGLRRLDPVWVAAAIAIGCIAASEWLDGVTRYMAMVGVVLERPAINAFGAVEETLELGIPLFAAIAIFAYFGGRAEAAGPQQ